MEGNTNTTLLGTILRISLNRNGPKVLRCFKGAKTDAGVEKVAPLLVDIVAIIGVAIAILVIVISPVLAADITGAFIIGFCPYIAFQKRQLLKLGTFREQLNTTRREVNEIMHLNDSLEKEVDELGTMATKMEEVESQLAQHAKTDKDNLQDLVDVVKRRKEINAEMNHILENQIIQHLITAVLQGDFNHDMKIGPGELRQLIMTLEKRKGFDFKKELFMKMLGYTQEPIPVERIMEVIRNLKDHSLAEEDSVFVIKPEQILEQ